MGVLNALTGSTSNSASTATSASKTFGTEASLLSQSNAVSANQIARENWEQAAQFNSQEAEKQRLWQEKMANTVYQRTVQDMLKAGINPVLAANMGLGTASVGSGASANMGDASSYMASAYADSISSAESQSHSHQESGLATGLQLLGQAIGAAIEKINSGNQIDIAINGLENWFRDQKEINNNVNSSDKKENQKGINQSQNYIETGHTNPFKKGTYAYQMYELQKATNSFTQTVQ